MKRGDWQGYWIRYIRASRASPDECSSLNWVGPDWTGLDRIASDWIRLDRIRSDWIGLDLEGTKHIQANTGDWRLLQRLLQRLPQRLPQRCLIAIDSIASLHHSPLIHPIAADRIRIDFRVTRCHAV